MAGTLTGSEMDFSGKTLSLVNYVIPPAVASVPEPSMLPLLAAGGAVASVVSKRMPSFFRAGRIDQIKGELLLLI